MGIDSLLKELLYHVRWTDFQILRNIKKHSSNDPHLSFKKLIDFSEIIPLILRYNKSPYIKLDYLFSILCHSHEILFRKFMTYVYKDKKVIKKPDIENLLIVNNFSIFNKTFTFQGRKYVSK